MSSLFNVKQINVGALGSIIIGNATGGGSLLTVGTTGQVLTVTNTGTLAWATPTSGTPSLAQGNIFIGNPSNAAVAVAPTAQGQVLMGDASSFATFGALDAQYVTITPDTGNNFTATTVTTAVTEIGNTRSFRYTGTVAPTTANDGVDTAALGKFFKVGDIWVNSTDNAVYINAANTTNAAVWQRVDMATIADVFTYKGTVDASQSAAAQGITAPLTGDYYRVVVAGTFGGVFTPQVEVNDGILYNGTTWDRIDNQVSAVAPADFITVTGTEATGFTVGASSFAPLAASSVLFKVDGSTLGGVAPTAALQVLRQNAGNTALEFAVLTADADFVDELTYSGADDPAAHTFSAFFTHVPISNTILVFVNGLAIVNADFSVSGQDLIIDFSITGFLLEAGDVIKASYGYLV